MRVDKIGYNNLWDKTLSEGALYFRYANISSVSFSMVPQEFWGLLFQNMVLLEPMLVLSEAIRRADRFPFTFELEDVTPII